MSAAEQADPTMPAPGEQGEQAAVIIDISTRASRRPDNGRRKPVDPTSAGPEPGPGTDPQQQLAEHCEIAFNHHRLTLTDEMTAAAYQVTLQLVREVLQGVEAQGIVDSKQRLRLDATVQAMAAAPGLVERSV